MGRTTISALEASAEDQLRYFKALIHESDRGAVLLSASRLDELLAELHKAHIRSVAKANEKFINRLFAPYAPLSSFSAKIEMAFGYGLISENDYLDINLLRTIRNDAAHTTDDFGFLIPAIRAKVRQFTAPKRVFQAFREKTLEIKVPELTDAEYNAMQSPPDDYPSTKMCFMLIGMCLSIVIMDKMTKILRNELNKPIA